MVEEFAANGDLLKKIKSIERIDENESRFLFRQLTEALMVESLIVSIGFFRISTSSRFWPMKN